MDLILPLLGVLGSMIIIWKACDGFEAGSNFVGRNLTGGVRGATINAIGSSIPELLATSIALLLYFDKDGFAFGIGTTAGSAVFNSAIIPALVILAVVVFMSVKRVEVSRKVILRDGIALLIAEAALIGVLFTDTLDWYHGLALIALYFGYMVYMFTTMKASEEDDEYEEESCWGVTVNTNLKAWLLLLVATVFIGGACHILVESCYKIGEILDIKVYFISVILAAAATSVPDTILSIKDAMAGESDDSVSNALGSNIFDICVCLGLPLFLFCLFTGQTISIGAENDSSVLDLRISLLVCTLAVFLIMLFGRKMGAFKAFLLLTVYGAFVFRILQGAGVF